ncbi:MAG TPA: DNA ligase D, partial [Caulifigura sp.]|nr:DNA ligase D [Caulifigura sp.]
FDGYRILAVIDNGQVRLLTRKNNDWTAKFPTLAARVADLKLNSAILDGELVVNDENGRTSFQKLQNVLRDDKESELIYYVFDLPYLNGFDLSAVSLRDRKAALESILKDASPANDGLIRYSDHIEGNGQHVFDQACKNRLEGILCKEANSPYEPRRSKTWLKVKCHSRQEFVIGGFSKPERSRIGFGALLLGYYENGKLQFAGRVGTGFDADMLRSLSKRLQSLTIDKSPYDHPLPSAERRGVTYVKPQLVCEVEFGEWTDDGRLRQPSFQGLREDKPAREVVRESAAGPKAIEEEVEEMPATKKRIARPKKPVTSAGRTTHDGSIEIQGVRISHPEKVLYPGDDITKGDIARYMETVADWILPYITERPLTIVRCPEGTSGQCFYQKHWTESLPDDVSFVPIREKNETENYLVIHDLKGLLSLIQISALELHPWGSKVDKLEYPDRIIFDLDPGPGVVWTDVCQGARDVRATLDEMGLESFVRTSGGKGLHVVVPLTRRNDWEEVKAFSHAVASGLAKHAPDHFVANMRKDLRKGRIFLDYLRNQRGATAIASYAVRARVGAPVATPVTWEEIGRLKGGDAFNIQTVPTRLKKLKRDPWNKLLSTRQSLSKAILEAALRFAE